MLFTNSLFSDQFKRFVSQVSSSLYSVKLPSDVDFESAAAAIGDGVKAYTALQYLGKMVAGETVMVTDAATGFGSLVVQLANSWGAKVNCDLENCLKNKFFKVTY